MPRVRDNVHQLVLAVFVCASLAAVSHSLGSSIVTHNHYIYLPHRRQLRPFGKVINGQYLVYAVGNSLPEVSSSTRWSSLILRMPRRSTSLPKSAHSLLQQTNAKQPCASLRRQSSPRKQCCFLTSSCSFQYSRCKLPAPSKAHHRSHAPELEIASGLSAPSTICLHNTGRIILLLGLIPPLRTQRVCR